jgi:phosphoribosylformylglycinamidine synthase
MAARIGIAVFPGSNCDRDVHYILNNIIGVEADFIWHTQDRISGYDAMIIPGGFAFGDRLRPGIIAAHSPMMNDSLRFVCRWTSVQVTNNKTPFTSQFALKQSFGIPIAHGDGRYVADSKILKELKKKNQIVLRYESDNPNGSTDLIAAICNEEGNVVGMMPHPERASERILNLDRSRNSSSEAITIFWSLVSNLKQKAIA